MRVKPTTMRFSSEARREQAKLLADRSDMPLTRYVAWCVDQLVTLAFLSPVNRELVRDRAAPHRPNSELAVIDDVITDYRELLDAGKIPAAPARVAARQHRLFALDARRAEREAV